ncbi:sensor domain-containing diguanylate cyclase [Methylomagnum ishizawai]|uniref:sensor domain-containing diguanylate cyclase n=1 Tax=Methylomagnum ishizawai TaxID=1760988 RepID=UPI001C32E7A4|nr:sensor domain-containing diguanylate cyclase [Methylomagnum ishizawai]BBL74485.1 hypothetical protein MishRS11D_15830 [Methylomagnum ishizawai]
MIGRDGDRIPVCVGAALFGHPPDQGVGFVLDMRERKRMEARLRLAARAIEDSGKAIVITDAENRVVFANRAFTEITGYAPHEVLGKSQHLFSPKTEHSLRETGRWEGEIVGRRKSGAAYPKWLSISAVKDEHGRVGHYVAIFSDITERKAMESKILHQARHDALTGLPNRLLLEEGLGCGMAEAERRHLGLAVLFLDLDGFKAVNDSFGHRVGDLLLRAVAERLRRGVRHDHDLVGRLGGDEFVVILNGIHHVREALAVAEELVDAIATPYDIEGRTLRIGTSIGISAYPQDGRSPAELLGHADSAMYQAKKQGRNTYRCYSPGPRVLN